MEPTELAALITSVSSRGVFVDPIELTDALRELATVDDGTEVSLTFGLDPTPTLDGCLGAAFLATALIHAGRRVNIVMPELGKQSVADFLDQLSRCGCASTSHVQLSATSTAPARSINLTTGAMSAVHLTDGGLGLAVRPSNAEFSSLFCDWAGLGCTALILALPNFESCSSLSAAVGGIDSDFPISLSYATAIVEANAEPGLNQNSGWSPEIYLAGLRSISAIFAGLCIDDGSGACNAQAF